MMIQFNFHPKIGLEPCVFRCTFDKFGKFKYVLGAKVWWTMATITIIHIPKEKEKKK